MRGGFRAAVVAAALLSTAACASSSSSAAIEAPSTLDETTTTVDENESTAMERQAEDQVEDQTEETEVMRKARSVSAKEYKQKVLLHSLVTSHGSLSPSEIRPNVFSYVIALDQPTTSFALVPKLDLTDYPPDEFADDELPKVSIDWTGANNNKMEPSARAIRTNLKLPADGSDLVITLKVSPSPALKSRGLPQPPVSEYTFKVRQAMAPPPSLSYISATDDHAQDLVIRPLANEDAAVYKLYVNPQASAVTLKLACTSSASLYVENKAVSNYSPVPISRDKTKHTQLIDVSCRASNKHLLQDAGKNAEPHYSLMLFSDWEPEDIPNPRLVLSSTGDACAFDLDTQSYKCPTIEDPSSTQLYCESDNSIKYLIESAHTPTSPVQVRLTDKQMTIPFSAAHSLKVTAEAGQHAAAWPITFGGSKPPAAVGSVMGILGQLLAIILAILLAALILVIALASAFGIGVPLNATEIAATLTFLIQYLCFANFIRGATAIGDLVNSLRWVTLFWPLPWSESSSGVEHGRQLLAVSGPSVSLWGDSILGDATDIRNACGCVFWSQIILLAFITLHGILLFKFHVLEKDFTTPHHVKLGNWESRCLHWLAFPTLTACAMLLASDQAALMWQIIGGVVVACYLGWIIASAVQVHNAVSSEAAVFVFNNSVREDGELEDQSGYWASAVADQLLTQPVNRSICRGLFPSKWISTVADIQATSIVNAELARQKDGVYPVDKFRTSHNNATYPLSKTPHVVDAVRTRHPSSLCAGHRLIAGLLRTQWLDLLFTFQALTKFHSEVQAQQGGFTVPLIVKTAQLSGSVTDGHLSFFFDGARVPFIRLADTIYRMLVGVFVGIALAKEGADWDTVMFSLVAAISVALLAYVASTMPYTRNKENWMVVGMLGVVTFGALAFIFYGYQHKEMSWLADATLWLTAALCFILAAYSLVVSFTVLSAVMCPPLEETRFLESLANCQVTISCEESGWNLEVPAYSKHPVKDLEARVTQTGGKRAHVMIQSTHTRAILEVSLSALKIACKSGYLVPPICSMFVASEETSLGYRCLAVSSREALYDDLIAFLMAEPQNGCTLPVARQVASAIASHIDSKNSDTLHCITLISDNKKSHKICC